MPDRQASPGEVTTRPDTGPDSDEHVASPEGSVSVGVPTDATNGATPSGTATQGHASTNAAARNEAAIRNAADSGEAFADATATDATARNLTAANLTAANVTTAKATAAGEAATDATVTNATARTLTPAEASALNVSALIVSALNVTASGEADPNATAAKAAARNVTASSATATDATAGNLAPTNASAPGQADPNAAATNGAAQADGAADRGAPAAERVAGQVHAEPDATEPSPARPGDGAPAAASVAGAAEQVTAPNATGTNATGPHATGPAPSAGTTSPPAQRLTLDDPTIATPRTTDGLGSWFASSDAESTQVILRDVIHRDTPRDTPRDAPATAAVPAHGVDAPTEQMRLPAPSAPPAPPPADLPESSGSGRARKRVLIGAGVVALAALLYGGDLLLSSGSVPRGTTVAGVSVGGLSLADAEQTLRTQIEPRTTRAVALTAGEARSDLDPRTAGLTVDWAATLDRAGSQPLNPITRITSFFTSREVGVATATDRAALDNALAQLAPVVDKVPVEGSVRFDGVTPVAVDPVPGQKLDAPAAAAVLERDWVSGSPVTLPVTQLPAVTTPEQVATAIEKVAAPAVAAPVEVVGENGTKGSLEPEVIARSLSFRADPTGLVPQINEDAVTEALKPQLAASEKPGRDAALDFSSGTAVVVPSQDGRGIDYPATLKDLLPVLTGTGERSITAVYADQPAKLTTEQLKALGISGVIGEFQTGGFAADSGQNIKRAADQINGKIVQPGETFSLNAVTNPRDAAHGYVEAGIIENGHAARGIGGGVSQVATTLYNAAYFAGMTNVEHKEHSFYISRYPAGREATVFDNVIDLKFRNDNPTAVMIQTAWTPSSLTVKIVGTKVWDVTSESGPRTDPTSPKTITLPAGDGCKPSQGAPGFTITNTRTLRNVKTGEVRVDPTRTVRYNPSPIVTCT